MNKSDFSKLLDELEKERDKETAMKLGIALLTSALTIAEKRDLFLMAFNIDLPDKIEAIINLWTVGVMLEDDLSIVQKISAVRGFLKDPVIEAAWVDEWIRQVWKRNEAPEDMLDFLALDLRNHPGIAEDLKKMLDERSR